MVAPPQCSYPKADIAKGVQHSRRSMTAMRDNPDFAHAANASAETTRARSTEISAAQRFSRDRSFKTVKADLILSDQLGRRFQQPDRGSEQAMLAQQLFVAMSTSQRGFNRLMLGTLRASLSPKENFPHPHEGPHY